MLLLLSSVANFAIDCYVIPVFKPYEVECYRLSKPPQKLELLLLHSCRYKELQSTQIGCHVLEGSCLEDALYTWSQFADECTTESVVMQLQQELFQISLRHTELRATHDKLIIHQTALANQIVQMAAIFSASNTELQRAEGQVQLDSSAVSAL